MTKRNFDTQEEEERAFFEEEEEMEPEFDTHDEDAYDEMIRYDPKFVRNSDSYESTQNFKSNEKWKKPKAKTDGDIVFQFLNIDYVLKPSIIGDMTDVRIYGVTETGASVLVCVSGFKPYLYIKWSNFLKKEHKTPAGYKKWLNDYLKEMAPKEGEQKISRNVVLDCKIINSMDIYYYSKNTEDFLQIIVQTPKEINILAELFKLKRVLTYESHVMFVLRFMIDKEIVGCGWIKIPEGKWNYPEKKQSTSMLEIECAETEIYNLGFDNEWSKSAPIRTLAFDIECCGSKGHFPNPKLGDPIILICNYVQQQGTPEPIVTNAFLLGKDCKEIEGVEIYCFDSEYDLLVAWINFFKVLEPDILTGYNFKNFDLNYIYKRAIELKIYGVHYLGRLFSQKSKLKVRKFSSTQMGTRETEEFPIAGVIQMDVLEWMRRTHKLSSYTLNAVASIFIKDKKDSIHHTSIPILWRGNDADRRILTQYCLKDALLVLKLINNQSIIIGTMALARVTGIPFEFVIARGQSIKTFSQLLRKSRTKGYLIPNITERKSLGKWKGGKVFKPKQGYYKDPVMTLDFQSLYPSIMISQNLCYTTAITYETAQKMDPKDYTKTPYGAYFVKPHIKEGILPLILTEWLAARKAVKDTLPTFKKNTPEYDTADQLQLALKVSANSAYGFTGASTGQLPMLSISASVTLFGQSHITETGNHIEGKFNIKNGYKTDAKVIYGDTDSVMLLLKGLTIEEGLTLGKIMAEDTSKLFIKPMKLTPEKIYCPYLLITKKRYAGKYWTKPLKPDKELDAKGLEFIRRDNTNFTRQFQKGVLEHLIVKETTDGLKEYIQKQILDLLNGKIDISDLIITNSITKHPSEYKTKNAGIAVAEKMMKRNPNNPPRVGDRVKYTIINAPGKDVKMRDIAETPEYIIENGLKLNYTSIFENKVKKVILRVLVPVFGEIIAEDMLKYSKSDVRVDNKITHNTKTGIMKFLTFAPNDSEIDKLKSNEEKVALQLETMKLTCKECQSIFSKQIKCANDDCDKGIFYSRYILHKRHSRLSDQIKIIDSTWVKKTITLPSMGDLEW